MSCSKAPCAFVRSIGNMLLVSLGLLGNTTLSWGQNVTVASAVGKIRSVSCRVSPETNVTKSYFGTQAALYEVTYSELQNDSARLKIWLGGRFVANISLKKASETLFSGQSGTGIPISAQWQTSSFTNVTIKHGNISLPASCYFTWQDGAFSGSAQPIPPHIKRALLKYDRWKEGCPVALEDLYFYDVMHYGYDGKVKSGNFVMHKGLSRTMLDIFLKIFVSQRPIAKMQVPLLNAQGEIFPDVINNSEALYCRLARGSNTPSNHSYGTAIDLNVNENPYATPLRDALGAMGWNGVGNKAEFLRGNGYPRLDTVNSFCVQNPVKCLLAPTGMQGNLNRAQVHPGMWHDGDAVVEAFRSQGFGWGGLWGPDVVDYMHFEYDARRLGITNP